MSDDPLSNANRPKPGSDAEYEWFGANARARGQSLLSNPYSEPPMLPGDMADPPESRARKAALWERGWFVENWFRRESDD